METIYFIVKEALIELEGMMRKSGFWQGILLKLHGIRLLRKGLWEGTGKDWIFAYLVEREERICSTLPFAIRSAKHEFVTPNKIP